MLQYTKQCYNANIEIIPRNQNTIKDGIQISLFMRLYNITYTQCLYSDIIFLLTVTMWLNTYNAGIGFTEQKSVCFLTFLKFQRLFYELMNQYQACLYLSECIFHCGFKYGHEIPQFQKNLQILLWFDLSSALVCRVESVKHV